MQENKHEKENKSLEHKRADAKFRTPKRDFVIIGLLCFFVIILFVIVYAQNSQINSQNSQINSLTNQLAVPSGITITGGVTIPSGDGPASEIIMSDAAGNTYYGPVNSVGQFSINVPNEDSYSVSIKYYQGGFLGLGAGYTTCNAGTVSVHSTSSSLSDSFSCS